MRLLALDIPDDPELLAGWLEGHLMGTDLQELVAELSVLKRPAEGAAAILPQVLADKADDLLLLGLRSLSRAQLRQLLQQPRLLLELQELVFERGGEYWISVPMNLEAAEHSKKSWQRLQESIRNKQDDSATVPRTAAFRTWLWAGTGWLAAMAAGVALFFVRVDQMHQLEKQLAQQASEIASLNKDLLAQRSVAPADLPEWDGQVINATSDPIDLPDDDPIDLPERN